MKVEVIFPGAAGIYNFPGLLEAFEFVVAQGKQNNFLVKTSPTEVWQDGAKLFEGMRQMFAPVEE